MGKLSSILKMAYGDSPTNSTSDTSVGTSVSSCQTLTGTAVGYVSTDRKILSESADTIINDSTRMYNKISDEIKTRISKLIGTNYTLRSSGVKINNNGVYNDVITVSKDDNEILSIELLYTQQSMPIINVQYVIKGILLNNIYSGYMSVSRDGLSEHSLGSMLGTINYILGIPSDLRK